MNLGNAFVPFYTTKASSSGIGLVLSRQIAEAQGGSELENLQTTSCLVTISLPIKTSSTGGLTEEQVGENLQA